MEKHITSFDQTKTILPQTPFVEALKLAFAKGDFQIKTQENIKSVLRYVEKAAILCRIDYISVEAIKPSHILALLEQCGQIKDRWSANSYNAYTRYISLLFSQLLQHQAVEFNPVRGIRKKKTVRNIRRLLSPEECVRVDQFTKDYDERLWRFIHIFFHSGSRTTEILKVQGQHVDLERQKVKYLILKGKSYEWVERTIKDIALPYWQKAMEHCSETEYVFSKGLKPGGKAIRAEQISRRWRKHIKQKLGIECDFYSLKHLNTDQTAAIFDLKTASMHNSHKSIRTTLIYAVNEKERVHKNLKGIQNSFAGQ